MFNLSGRNILTGCCRPVGTAVYSPTVLVGTVSAAPANQTYGCAGGYVTGLDRTTLCPSAGEAGAPIVTGTSAVAVTRGGSADCTSVGSTYGVPVVPILAAFGLSIY